MKLYKLTDAKGQTLGGTQWGPGVTHAAIGSADQPLCSSGWIHAYTHPLLAVMLNPIHGNFTRPRLWLAKGKVGKRDRGLKVGCRKLTTIKELALPEVTITQRVAFGILCSLQCEQSASYKEWAKDWLSGKDRTAVTARSAVAAEWAEAAWAAWAAWAASAWSAAEAAWSAAWAAWAASAWAAPSAAEAAWSAAWAAWAASAWAALSAAEAAWSAAWAAWAASAAKPIPITKLARQAMRVK